MFAEQIYCGLLLFVSFVEIHWTKNRKLQVLERKAWLWSRCDYIDIAVVISCLWRSRKDVTIAPHIHYLFVLDYNSNKKIKFIYCRTNASQRVLTKCSHSGHCKSIIDWSVIIPKRNKHFDGLHTLNKSSN